jgi:hypothetical protein
VVDLASRRITITKIGGAAAEVVELRLRKWSAARQMTDRDEWSFKQWHPHLRQQADSLADRLRAHALALPVVYFIEWADLWSMGDLYRRWLTPPSGPAPLSIHANRFEIYG